MSEHLTDEQIIERNEQRRDAARAANLDRLLNPTPASIAADASRLMQARLAEAQDTGEDLSTCTGRGYNGEGPVKPAYKPAPKPTYGKGWAKARKGGWF
jgi:hypothetical protein